MPDIHLRFHQDMLVLSADIANTLQVRGYETNYPRELLAVVEPDSIIEPLRLEQAAGAACLVLPTKDITRARLAHIRAEDRSSEIAQAALKIARDVPFMHTLAEIGPTGLPLDPSSKTSLVANRDQYADAARLFPCDQIDALFINGITTTDDLRCALMGVSKASDAIVFASVDVNDEGYLTARNEPVEDAIALMEEYGAGVCGIQTPGSCASATAVAKRMAQATELPLLVQLQIRDAETKAQPCPYPNPDSMLEVAEALRACDVQFLRATGAATPAYTATLSATCFGKDAIR